MQFPKNIFSLLFLTTFILGNPFLAHCQVSGACSNCHTMHSVQDGSTVTSGGTNQTLLTNDCVGCHSSHTSSTYYDLDGCKVPVVLYTAGEPKEYLAGGNFYWVKEGLGDDDTKGHNVFRDEKDEFLDIAPGGSTGCGTTACHANLSNPYTGFNLGGDDLKGKYGCQGCHLNVRHHANDHPNSESGLVNSEEQGWYRFLSGHKDTGAGVEGYEDGVWEAGLHNEVNHSGSTAHNEYLGNVVTGGYGFKTDGGLGNTTSAFCTGCHGLFHEEQQDSNNIWLRHPSDALIPNSGEYQYCTTYDPLTPVARNVIPDTPASTVKPGEDMVMCLSCHRPHGSPYADMLRWDYSAQISGGGAAESVKGTGCFFCHTTKDD